MATDQLLHLAGASTAEGVEGPPGGWQAWAKAVSASSAGCGPPGEHATPGDDASGAALSRGYNMQCTAEIQHHSEGKGVMLLSSVQTSRTYRARAGSLPAEKPATSQHVVRRLYV